MRASFTRYLPPATRSGPWGLDLRAGGWARIPSHVAYPAPGHPRGYDFDPRLGRVLGHHAIIRISAGGGTFRDHGGAVRPVVAGSLIVLSPGRWHSYQPDPRTGWEEHWLAFDGPAARMARAGGAVDAGPLVEDAAGDTVIGRMIDEALDLLCFQPSGWLAEAEACLARLLARLVARRTDPDDDRQARIRRVAIALAAGSITVVQAAHEAGLSPAQFRRRFRAATGHAPRNYGILMRLERAKHLLLQPHASVAGVADRLGFASASYFSRLFTRHCGCAPGRWRPTATQVP